MDPDRRDLASEARAAIRRGQPPAAATVLVDERRRRLPFVVIGGAVLGCLAGALGQLTDDARDAMAVGLGAGTAAGMVAGWPMFGLAGKLVGDRSLRAGSLLVIQAALVIPAYVVAGFAAMLATLAVAQAMGRAGEALGTTLNLLLWGSLVIIPLSVALASSRRTPLVTSAGLGGAVGELVEAATTGEDNTSPISRVGGAILSGLIWFVAGSVIVLAGLASLSAAFPAQYAAATGTRGTLFGVAVVVAWVAVIVAGSSMTYRIFFGRGGRKGARKPRRGRPDPGRRR